MSSPEKLPLASLSRGDLEALIEHLLAENAALKRTMADLRAAVAQLKGVNGKPAIKPAAKPRGMAAGAPPVGERRARRRGRAGKVSEAVACEDRVLSVPVPAGSRCKGYDLIATIEKDLQAAM